MKLSERNLADRKFSVHYGVTKSDDMCNNIGAITESEQRDETVDRPADRINWWQKCNDARRSHDIATR